MQVTNPPNVNLSQIVVDAGLDLSGGDYDIAMKAGRTIDGKDVSTLGDMLKSVYDNNDDGIFAKTEIESFFDKVLLSAPPLTVAIHVALTATGSATNPDNLNDGNAATNAVFDAVDEYVEIDFGSIYMLSQFRIDTGDLTMAGDGRFTLKYWNVKTEAWVDWKTSIPTDGADTGFSAWEILGLIVTSKMRLVATTVDSRGANPDESYVPEIEFKY